MYSAEIIENIRQANPIEEVVGGYTGLKNKRGLCPWHEDKNPSLHINSEKGIAKCFVCMDKAVDVFGFVMKAENVSFPEAVKILADRKGIKLANALVNKAAKTWRNI